MRKGNATVTAELHHWIYLWEDHLRFDTNACRRIDAIAELHRLSSLLNPRDYEKERYEESIQERRSMKKQKREWLEVMGFAVKGNHVSCDSCAVIFINGYPTHETGCRNARHECRGCNAIIPANQRYCQDCQ